VRKPLHGHRITYQATSAPKSRPQTALLPSTSRSSGFLLTVASHTCPRPKTCLNLPPSSRSNELSNRSVRRKQRTAVAQETRNWWWAAQVFRCKHLIRGWTSTTHSLDPPLSPILVASRTFLSDTCSVRGSEFVRRIQALGKERGVEVKLGGSSRQRQPRTSVLRIENDNRARPEG